VKSVISIILQLGADPTPRSVVQHADCVINLCPVVLLSISQTTVVLVVDASDWASDWLLDRPTTSSESGTIEKVLEQSQLGDDTLWGRLVEDNGSVGLSCSLSLLQTDTVLSEASADTGSETVLVDIPG